MAKLFLESTDTTYKVSSANTKVYGATGDQVVTVDAAATGVTFDANVEGVSFSGATSDFTYKQLGLTDLGVYKAGALYATVAIQDDATGSLLTFSNGTVATKFATTGGVTGLTFGGTAVSATSNTTVTPVTIDATSGNGSTSTGVTGSTFTLTTGTDNFLGTAGNDTFNASANNGNQTFTSGDVIDGGAGDDVLNVEIAGGNIYQAASLKNVEAIEAAFTSAGTLSLLGSTGVTKVTAYGDSADATFSNIASTNVALAFSNTTQSATYGFAAAAVAGATDSATLTLTSVSQGNGESITINKVETLNLVSSGSANTVKSLTADTATKLVISGDQDLTLTSLAGASLVATIDATAATSAVTVSLVPGANTVMGGAGNDSITNTAAGNVSQSGGLGDDTFVFDATATFTNSDTVNGGDGNDTITATSASLTGYTAPSTATVSSIETLKVSDAALGGDLTTATIVSGVSTVNLALGAGAARTLTLEAGTKTVLLGAAGTGHFTVSDTGTATNDVLNVTNKGAAISTFGNAAGDLIVNGFETVNFSTSGTGAATTQALQAVTLTADTGGTSRLNFTGSNTVTTTGAITASIIDASGLTGSAKLTLGAAAASVTSIIGSAGADTLLGDTSSNINGGAGKDSITGGSGNDTLLGGADDDSITSAAGNDSIDGGTGNDELVLDANLATGDVIDGGDGTDTLSLTNASLTTLGAYSISAATNLNSAINNVERIVLTDALNQTTFDDARLDSINYITLQAGTTGAEALTGLANNATLVIGDDSTLTATLSDSSGSADVINFVLNDLDGTPSDEPTAGSLTTTSLTTSGVETINISAIEATASATVRTYTVTSLAATGANAVNFSGTEAVTVTNATALKYIDATGLTAGALSISVANAALSATVIGGAGGDTVVGSANGDVITGNAGADSLDGAAGNDTLSGGTGADTLVGGAGNDSIVAGEGIDSIVAGAGNDTIDLTEDTAVSDTVFFLRSDTAGLDLSVANSGKDTITGFTAGAGGDVLSFDTSATPLFTNTTQKVATLSADGTTLTPLASSGAIATDVDVVIVLGDYGSYAAVQAQLNSTAGAINDTVAIVVWRDGVDTHVYFDDNISAGAGTGTELAVLVGVNTANLVAGNFDIIA
jgi:Ca2+-binding RTX toxin-like protein